MKEFLGNIFGRPQATPAAGESSDRELIVATAALLLEIARVDDHFTDEERTVIVEILKEHFGITAGEVEEILEATDHELDKRIDLYYFTSRINEKYDIDRKIEIMEMIWSVIYTDDHLDGHEDYLVHRFAKLLRLPHSQLIEAKLRVKEKK